MEGQKFKSGIRNYGDQQKKILTIGTPFIDGGTKYLDIL